MIGKFCMGLGAVSMVLYPVQAVDMITSQPFRFGSAAEVVRTKWIPKYWDHYRWVLRR